MITKQWNYKAMLIIDQGCRLTPYDTVKTINGSYKYQKTVLKGACSL